MKKIVLIATLLLVCMVPVAPAAIIWNDPAVLFIGNPPSPILGGGTYLFGDEVTAIADDSLQILLNGAGHPTLDSPMLLILGVPNSTSLTPEISDLSSGTAADPVFETKLDPSEEVYSVLGLGDGTNNSNSFTNWSAADLAVNGIDADYFGLFVYRLYDTGISGGSILDVAFSSDLPDGTFAIAYGQKSVTHHHDTCITAYSTPFTEAGLTHDHKVPEPGMMMLFGTGLVGLAFFGRRMFVK